MKHYKVAIIGAGSSGMTARYQVSKQTDNYIVIDDGELGTTCARMGCMPSKALIEAANLFYSRQKMTTVGISGQENMEIDHAQLMEHVRSMRDQFVGGVLKGLAKWTPTHLLKERAKIIGDHQLQVGDEIISADSIIIATGSRPVIPKSWLEFSDLLISNEQFFNLKTLPKKVALIGLGVIGVELGQALSRLGIEVIAVGLGNAIGGLTDPFLQDYALTHFAKEFPVYTSGVQELRRHKDGLELITPDGNFVVEKALVAVGRRPNIDKLGLENLSNIEFSANGIPVFNPETQAIKGSEHVFLTGDANGDRPILHEAADEGHIAGYNAVRGRQQAFKRRTPIAISFSSPNVAFVGENHQSLTEKNIDFVTGGVSYEKDKRAKMKQVNHGLVHVYADRETGKLLGAEFFAPNAEHMAHALAWLIDLDVDVYRALAMPFYHPVFEESLRTALRGAARQTKLVRPLLDTPLRN